MKKLLLAFTLLTTVVVGQNPAEALRLVKDGVKMHDANMLEEAIKLYEEALKVDKNNYLALSEIAMTYSQLGDYKKAIAYCELAIKTNPKEDLRYTYVTYANSFDHLKDSKKAIATYNKAINLYPDFYQLYFNRGVTNANLAKLDACLEDFKKSYTLNRNHANSLNAVIMLNEKKRIPTILGTSCYLLLDNKSQRAQTHYERLRKNLKSNITIEGNQITINLDPSESGKKKNSDNFMGVDMYMSILNLGKVDSLETQKMDTTLVGSTLRYFENLTSSLEQSVDKNQSFYWKTMVPFLIEIKKNDWLEPFVHTILLPSNDQQVLNYHQTNKEKLDEFMAWSRNYRHKL